jgi:TPR repeat protein
MLFYYIRAMKRIYIRFVFLLLIICSAVQSSFGQVDSFAYFKELAEKGDTKAQYQVGMFYFRGNDSVHAKEWFGKSAEKLYPPALTYLALIYENGLAGTKDYQNAFQYLKEACDSGYADAQLEMGYYYMAGWGTKADSSLAEKWFRKAAAQDQPLAINNIAFAYLRGYMGLPKSAELALPYLIKAADMGVSKAQFEMGLLYQNGGAGLEVDTEKAFRWYDKAAKQLYLPALNNYAWLCFLKKKNINKAIQYIEVVVRLTPENINALDTYAALLLLAGEYDQALKWQKKALDLGGDRRGGFLERYGDILSKLNKHKEAMKYWKAAQAFPGHSTGLIDKITSGNFQK